MTTKTTHACNLCRDKIEGDAMGVGLSFTLCSGLPRIVHTVHIEDVNVHLCSDCFAGLKEMFKRRNADEKA